MRSLHILVGALLLASAFTVGAIPSFCNSGAADFDPSVNDDTPQLSVNNMSYNANPATDCYGKVVGNDDAAAINALGNWGTGWALAARDNTDPLESDVTNLVSGIQWQITADLGVSGNYLVTGVDMNGVLSANLGDVFDFVFTLKGGNGYALYLFENMVFDGSDGGAFNIVFLNNGDQRPNLSHATGYVRFDSEGGGGGGGNGSVPEPPTILLVGAGIAGLWCKRRYSLAKAMS